MIIWIVTACEKDIPDVIDYSDFASLNDSSLYTTLTPSGDCDYFELRWAWCGSAEYQIEYSHGLRCSPGTDTALCAREWDSVYSEIGFFQTCLPACCHYYFVSRTNDQIQVYNDTESVISFLRPIDTPADALMIAFTQGYSYRTADSTLGGIRELRDSYQLIVLKLVGICDPIQTNKYLLEIDSGGDIEIIESDVYESIYGACIK